MSIRIISYNVLSSELVDPERYTSCTEDDLDSDRRYSAITETLRLEVAKKSIICLQEVSLTWAARLQLFFYPLNYCLVKCQYSGMHSGYMGCLTAFPTDVYQLTDCYYCSPFHSKLALNKPGLLPTLAKSMCQLNSKWLLPALTAAPCLAFLADYLLGTSSLPTLHQKFLPLYAMGATVCASEAAKNTLLPTPGKFESPDLSEGISARHRDVVPMVKLQHTRLKKQFWVANTHMPCKFYNQKLMAAYAWHIAEKVQDLADDIPYLLVGDFNAKPKEVVYELLSTGAIRSDHPDRPRFMGEPVWLPVLRTPFRSAYHEANGSEPEFTNFSKLTINGKEEDTFCEVLDYIWMSPEWRVETVVPVPPVAEATRGVASFPSVHAGQPSDHVLIGADLAL